MSRGISLSELAGRIGLAVRSSLSEPVWVRAEINALQVNGGHCYMELVEKQSEGDGVVAKCRAACWAATFRMLKPYFEQHTGQELRAGLQVLLSVTVDFHQVYGLSLTVRDIDPVFTVGELAARRAQIMRRLEEEGVAEMNKQLPLPVPARRVAVVSSPTAAGYEDFCNQLRGNTQGYVFQVELFAATMQGDRAAASIVAALDKVYARVDSFDVVVIIRGGGAATDLAAFDSYDLALHCAQFPLPVVAGIGHQRDVSILDRVAHTSVKTPTAAAEYLIDNLREAEARVDDVRCALEQLFRERIERESRRIEQGALRLHLQVEGRVLHRAYLIDRQAARLRAAWKMCKTRRESHLHLMEERIRSYSPAFLLQRGVTITTLNGRRLCSSASLRPGDRLRTYFPDGTVDSLVTSPPTRLDTLRNASEEQNP